MVRAKFKVTKYETSIYGTSVKQPDGSFAMVKREMRTITMHPVYGESSPENKAFWDASPSGELKLGTVNPAAWQQFELDREYYLDFTPADPAQGA